MLDVLALDHSTLVGTEVSHVPHRHRLVAAQVATDIVGQEPVRLSLAGILRPKCRCWHPYEFLLLILSDLVEHCLVIAQNLLLAGVDLLAGLK